jgi:phosphoribosylglycinamide formyltransferase 1
MTSQNTESFSIAVLISGAGTTLRNLIEYRKKGQLHCDIRLVIASRADAAGLTSAQKADIDFEIVQWNQYETTEEFSSAIFSLCREANIDLVVMGGFLKLVVIPPDFENRVINIHPSLIPNFCGKGMYGQIVHQAVLDSQIRETGCTVHYVDNQYDHGPVISQSIVPVQEDDDVLSLQRRVFEAECQLYPAVINQLAQRKQ